MSQTNGTPTVIRTGRGLTVGGSRLTLYTLMDRLKEEWPPHLIRDWYNLTDQQMQDILAYIEAHREEVEAEYQQVLREAAETEQYWREKNREHFAHIATLPPPFGKEAIYAKLKAEKKRLGMA